ncbi:hypothetical protein AWM70_05055 [Paenibacillus yonginensis]|uniref:Flagellar biosynthesis protein FlhF n=1 Tax=Paenibacillus yonginensis TaxID=1462996 RepID=A0A1B1MXX0_9BACL|nr:flagellar biosynthesis protein FlhF [Paenibacillus yonginensis]ANS74016.1 hypothetical protein AWM70_05055 [Paenibacillus yonginensis]
MRVKRYIVETMPDAMLKIRKDLGGDAVILSTKKIKVGGFLGMFGKVKLEVIAGVDEMEETESLPRSNPPAAKLDPIQPANRMAASSPPGAVRQANGREREARAAASAAAQQTAAGQASTSGRVGAQAYRRAADLAAGAASGETPQAQSNIQVQNVLEEALPEAGLEVQNERRPSGPRTKEQQEGERASFFPTELAAPLETLTAQPRVKGKETSGPAADDLFRKLLLNDIQQMKAMMNKLAKEQSDERILPGPLDQLLNRLKAQEVEPELAESWIEPVYEAWEASGESLGELELKQKVRREISRFLETRLSEGISDTARMVYVAGPTGVGKTTTIAKMAADQIFRKQKKVGFITADTYRISAVEQLRTYASILNVPLEVVQSPGDMKRAAARLENCDLIFMDTAGRNYLNELYVAELHSLLAVKEQSETCLVLSLTSKSKDMKTISEHFSKYGLDKVIFTKLDETESCGSMFNLLSQYPLKLLFLTNGQNVPDDLVSVDQEMLIHMLLGDEGV